MDLRAVRGMNDILPDEAAQWQRLEAVFRAHVELYGYAEVRTPLLEPTELFVRQIGEATDVVEKEMYSFERHGDRLTVRPEGTAGAARAYVEHAVHAREPVTRWYYLGPMFRGERPAKGRYRQFHQAGCEHYGEAGPLCDAEMIDLVGSLLAKLGVPDYVAHVSSLGSAATQARYREAIRAYLQPLRGRLSEDSQRRLERNPLRILDSKDPRDREVIAGAPSILDLLDGADEAHWKGLLRHLDMLGVRYVVDPSLVRGLDYYTRTLFEHRTSAGDLGAQNTLAGGGRYDGMVAGLGGPEVPAIGFAMGLERILAVVPRLAERKRPTCFVAPLGEAAEGQALLLARDLRALGLATAIEGRGGRLKAMLRRADALGARFCLIVGEAEIARGVAAVKDLVAHTQDEIALDDVARTVADRAAGSTPPAAASASQGSQGGGGSGPPRTGGAP